jgi:hypothetical protein
MRGSACLLWGWVLAEEERVMNDGRKRILQIATAVLSSAVFLLGAAYITPRYLLTGLTRLTGYAPRHNGVTTHPDNGDDGDNGGTGKDGGGDAAPFAGSGTESDPFQLRTATDLHNIRISLSANAQNSGLVYYQLQNDITLDSVADTGETGDAGAVNFIPIDNFDGVLDGGGFSVQELFINTPNAPAALFLSTTKRSIIRNLHITAAIKGTEAAALVLDNGGTIENCSASGIVTGSNQTGGIAALNTGEIKNCSASGVITGSIQTGGIAALNSGEIKNCSASGIVTGSNQTGGIAALNTGVITYCRNEARVSGAGNSDSHTGGIAGESNSIAAGQAGGVIAHCINEGAVGGTYFVGGICGFLGSAGLIANCLNRGAVTANDFGGHIGGITGADFSQLNAVSGGDCGVIKCISAGAIKAGEDCFDIGIIAGSEGEEVFSPERTYSRVIDCYYLSSILTPPITNTIGEWDNKTNKIKVYPIEPSDLEALITELIEWE